MYNDDDEIEKLAKENNISEGKANLISKVLKSEMKDSKGNLYTFESLAKLSINELNLLLNSKNVVLSEVSSIGTANEKSYIGTEKAKEIAFSKAGVTANDVYDLEIELDCDDGILIYEVEFKSEKNEYEYDINAKDGNIIKSSVDINDDDDDDDDDKINTNVNTGSNTNSQTTNNSNKNNSNRYDDDRYDDDDDDRGNDRAFVFLKALHCVFKETDRLSIKLLVVQLCLHLHQRELGFVQPAVFTCVINFHTACLPPILIRGSTMP